jgi:hypothetical protein
MSTRKKFSVSWFVGVAFLHIVVTVVLYFANFFVALGAMSTGPSGSEHFTRKIQWVWTPLAMLSRQPDGSSSDALTEVLALFWSAGIGLVAGIAAPLLREEPIDPKLINKNPDLAGTPWATDPHHTNKTP